MTQHQAPFRSVEAALRFLFDPERVVCNRSAISRMADSRYGEPGPLSGLDGAATAAIAEAMLQGNLSPLHLAILACRFAPALEPCNCGSPCCSRRRPSPRWQQAAALVADEAMAEALADCTAHKRFVAAVLAREYGATAGRVNLNDVGEDLGMSSGTCTNHRHRVLHWLLGDEHAHKRRTGPPQPGQEVRARQRAEEVLCCGGFVG